MIGALTNLVAVPLSGPILTLGLLGSVVGNLTPALAYPLNASNGFLVTILERVARTASASPLAAVTTPEITPPLVGLFYLGCIPAALCETAFPEGRWPLWAAILVLWTRLWLALVGVGGPSPPRGGQVLWVVAVGKSPGRERVARGSSRKGGFRDRR